MNLVIDIGNTRVKIAVFKEDVMLSNNSFSLKAFPNNIEKIIQKNIIDYVIIASVGDLKKEYIKFFNSSVKVLILTHKTKIPFKNKYKTPQTLGVDRIALIVAAVKKFPNKNTLVIDAGSCITYDFINDKNEYFGGSISPGIEMRYKSLNSYTSNLPNLSIIDKIPKIGNSTKNAIHLGVLNGVILEIEGIISQFKAKNEKLTIVLTGGDTIFLARNIKSSIFANPNFLLEGLNSILIYNTDV
ncbi:MAG: type III pantothenate kinase [Flavobacteriaceae bacterium]|nr:type III pantothenate kinase [Flavobacteriaceae bacterium]